MERSESIKNIAKALQVFRMKVDKIKKTSENPYFKKKYAGLPEILDAIQSPLDEAELTFTQMPDGDSLTTILIHVPTGEYFQSTYAIHPVKNDPQAIGSAITYARRYAIGAMLSLNVVEDDDGNSATGNEVRKEEKKPVKSEKKEVKPNLPPISEKQLISAIERIKSGQQEIFNKVQEIYSLTPKETEELNEALQFSRQNS